MYVYYKDKNDTIGFVDLKLRNSHRFENPVFIFHIEKSVVDKQMEEINLKEGKQIQFVGLNPYELAYVSGNLNYEFPIQDHMFGIKRIDYKII